MAKTTPSPCEGSPIFVHRWTSAKGGYRFEFTLRRGDGKNVYSGELEAILKGSTEAKTFRFSIDVSAADKELIRWLKGHVGVVRAVLEERSVGLETEARIARVLSQVRTTVTE